MRSSRRLARTTVLAGLVGALTLSFGARADTPPPPAISSTLGFSVAPYAEPGAPPRADFIYDVSPGQSLTDRVVISNPNPRPKAFYVYTSDVYNASLGGGLGARARTEKSTDAATWIKLPGAPTGQLTVPANAADILNVALTVPVDANPGDHVAAVIAEEILPPAPLNHGTGVQRINRVGSQVMLRVAGPIHPALALTHLSVTHHLPLIPFVTGRGTTTVTFTLVNSGNVRVQLDQIHLALTGAFGRQIHGVTLTRAAPGKPQTKGLPDEILPTGQIEFSRVFEGLPPLDHVTAHVWVKGVDPVSHLPASVSVTRGFWVIPWLVILIVIAVLVTVWLWRRRTPEEPQPVVAVPVPARQ